MTGRLHEFIRLFERAFARAATQVCKNLLPVFLRGCDLNYTETELSHWLYLRDKSSHADRDFVLEQDTRQVVNRIEQAAYDVLLNKVDWHTPSIDRRNNFFPLSGPAKDRSSDVFITKGFGQTVSWQPFDCFGIYPTYIGEMTCVPDTWLTRTSIMHSDEEQSQKVRLHIGNLTVKVIPD